jgi:hypothetical protein
LKKSLCPNCLIIDWLKRFFCTLLREIRVRMPLPNVKISISDAYFSDAQTMADFFNRISRSLPIALTKRAGKIRCNHWSGQMQSGGQVPCNSPQKD